MVDDYFILLSKIGDCFASYLPQAGARIDNSNKIKSLLSLRGVPRGAGRRGNLDFELM
jgi:hypothetical protein